MRILYEEVLDFFLWGLETFSRRDCGLILAGYRVTDSERRANQMLDRLAQQRLLKRVGRGQDARFSITTDGQQRTAVAEPTPSWNRRWDGQWRVVGYDLPETRRKDRLVLWQALRARKLGLLQRSMWVWPHDLEPILVDVIHAKGIPECFCGFEAHRLFLCNDAEVVLAAWDFEEISRRQHAYLKHLVANISALKAAGTLVQLAHIARVERQAYQFAFSLDPLLPRSLCPKDYEGFAVEQRRQQFRDRLRRRCRDLRSS